MTRKPFLVEYADKLAILLIPYLFLISFCYNLGYWGILRFDIYNYLSFQDLLKGVGTSIQFTFLATVLVGFAGIFVAAAIPLLINHKRLRWLITGIIALLLSYAIFDFFSSETSAATSKKASLTLPWWFSIFTTGIPLLVTLALRQKLFGDATVRDEVGKLHTRWVIILYEAIIFILLALPLNALETGLNNANKLLNRYVFDYVAKPSYQRFEQLKDYPYLIYVGKAGDYHFLLTPDGKRRIAMPKDSLAPVVLSDFNINGEGMSREPLPK